MFYPSNTPPHTPATPPQLTDSTLAQPTDSAATKLLIAWLIIYNLPSTHSPFRIKLFLSFGPNFPGLVAVSLCPGGLREPRSPRWSSYFFSLPFAVFLFVCACYWVFVCEVAWWLLNICSLVCVCLLIYFVCLLECVRMCAFIQYHFLLSRLTLVFLFISEHLHFSLLHILVFTWLVDLLSFLWNNKRPD